MTGDPPNISNIFDPPPPTLTKAGKGGRDGRISDSEVFNKNETKREGEKGEHIGVRIYRILKKMY